MGEERINAAAKLILQAPPGEINDVLNDVRDIISDDAALETGTLPALRTYNLEQFVTINVPNQQHQVIVSDVGKVGGDISSSTDVDARFLDPRSKTTFVFDHLRLEAADPQPYEVNEQAEEIRSALDAATMSYLEDHFHDGVTTVFSVPNTTNDFIIQIVANKYNPQNYWSGRWRSEYKIDLDRKTVEGRILVNVHYYEQGNVQLATTHNITFAIPSSTTSPKQTSEKILALIEHEEGNYQVALNDAYHEMAEKTFKGLRRALPLTRQKMDWDRILGYKLGAELTASRGVLGGS